MTPAELKGAAEVLGRLADAIAVHVDMTKRVEIPFEWDFFVAIQTLLAKTEWAGRFCWHLPSRSTGGRYTLSVDISPLPTRHRCGTCGGTGHIEVA